jgi:hypothetical protein
MSNRLGDLISRGEGGYNSYNRGTSNGHIQAGDQEIDFSQISLDELQRRQALPSGDHQRLFAVGKYQVIPKTLSKAIADLRLSGDERFSPSLQERIFSDYLIAGKRPAISKYIRGADGATLHSALKATCQEWASVEDVDTPGKPYGRYGQQGNRATTRAGDVAIALNEMRSEYLAGLERGLTAREAWRSITGQKEASPEFQVASSEIKRSPPFANHVHPMRLPSKGVSHKEGESMPQLQHTLAVLGYHGAHGRHLAADGHFGHNTRHAVMAFQQAHHLHVDGVVGRHTLAALDHARHSPLLSEATHPQHALYAQALHGVRRLPEAMFGSARAQHNAAATLTVTAHASGLNRIDHVVLGANAVRLFAVQGRMEDPAHRRVHVDRMQAVAQTVEHATLALQKPAMTPEVTQAHVVLAAQVEAANRDVSPGMQP